MNNVLISGTVSAEPMFSHNSFGINFWKFEMKCDRLSGVPDKVTCLIPEEMIGSVFVGNNIEVYGEIRTYNKDVDGTWKMLVYVFVNSILDYEECDKNNVYIEGYICKKPVFRKTILGREITDLIIASNRQRSGKSDYIPCIAWGINAKRCANMEIGTKLKIFGRFQSRDYMKQLDEETSEVRTAYEVSTNRIEVYKNEECKECE